MLLGRAAETARLSDLLDQARQGRSRVLVVSGEPGVGKTALLDFAASQAGDLRVRQIRAAEAERGLPFAGLSALLRPWEAEIDLLPFVQAAALKGALALGPAAAGDRFAVAAATLGLLTIVAEQQPMLLTLDDLHWMDTASAEAVLFAARRLDHEGIAIILGTRVAVEGWDTLELDGIDAAAASALMSEHCGRQIAPKVADQLVRDTAGNPLALIELARLLDHDVLTGGSPLPVPLPVGRATTALFAPRLSTVGPQAQSALLLAALTDTDVDVVQRAAARLDLPPEAVTRLDGDGLVVFEAGRLVFAHPLIRSAVVEMASPAKLRAAHRALAQVLDGPLDTERRAWHLAESVIGRDEQIAAELERMADSMRDKRAYQVASTSYQRAAELATDRARYARCRFQAAAMAWFAGNFTHARDLAAETGVEELEGIATAEAQYVLGGIELFLGHPEQARQLLSASAASYLTISTDVAMERQLDAVLASYVGNDFESAAELALEATQWKSSRPALTGLGQLLAGVSILTQGDPATGAELITSAVNTAELVSGVGLHNQHTIHAAHELVRVGLPLAAKRILEPLVDRLRANVELGMLPYALHIAAVVDARSGHLDAAYAAASESTRLGGETGNPLWHYRGMAVLAYVQALRGDETESRRNAAEARRLGEQLGTTSARYIDEALAALDFALGNTRGALEHVAAVGYFRNCSSAMLLTWPGAMDLAEVYARDTEKVPDHLHAALDRTIADGIAAELPGQAAGLARLRGLMAEDLVQAEEFLDEAVTRYTSVGLRLDAARTLLSWGEKLRRHGKLAAARTRLGAAFSSLEGMGARLWADRAMAELRATGAKNLPATRQEAQPLTPQEMQVALAVANGATNRETAGSLFLSTKTVEMHLTHVYRKLGVRSRTELARRFSDGHEPRPAAPPDGTSLRPRS